MYFNRSFTRFIGLITIAVVVLFIPQPQKPMESTAITAIGDPGLLKQRYEAWKQKQKNIEGFTLAASS